MDLLLLPHSQPTTEVSMYIAKLKEVKLNVAQLQESIESLKLPSGKCRLFPSRLGFQVHVC